MRVPAPAASKVQSDTKPLSSPSTIRCSTWHRGGATVTKVVSGAWEAVDPKTGAVLSEAPRLKLLGVL